MEEEDNIIVKWAQGDVETSYKLLNNNIAYSLPKRFLETSMVANVTELKSYNTKLFVE